MTTSLFVDLVEHPELSPQFTADTISRVVGQKPGPASVLGAVSADVARTNAGMFHGIAVTDSLIFTCITVPVDGSLAPGYYAIDRLSGVIVGSMPPPASGFALPFTCRTVGTETKSGNVRTGQVLFFDAGAFPIPGVQAKPIITVYSYTYNTQTGALSATIVRNSNFPTQVPGAPIPWGFQADPEVLPDGSVAFADQVQGAVYLWKTDGSVVMALGPATSSSGDAIPQLASGTWVSTQKATLTFNGFPPQAFEFVGNYAPGANYLSHDSTYLYFENEARGSVYRIPIAALTDNRTPSARCASIEPIWQDPTINDPNARITYFAGHVRDPANNNLYLTGFGDNCVYQIDVTAPSTQPLLMTARDVELYKGPVSIACAPPSLGQTPLYVVSDMEYLLFGLNPFIPPPPPGPFQKPWYVTALLRP